MSQLRTRARQGTSPFNIAHDFSPKDGQHPPGPSKISSLSQAGRVFAFVVFFLASTVIIHITQFMGVPLYFVNRDYYYGYMAFTKQQFGVVLNTITEWFAPTLFRISGDKSVKGQMKLNKDGLLETSFAPRLIMIVNHQIYTEWLYLWWLSYTSGMHGHIFIILKQSLQYMPLIGPGMKFFGFIFMARNWGKDQPRMHHRLQTLNSRHRGPLSGSEDLDPMWLLIFPEGTNLSMNGRKASQKWAAKQNIPDMKHTLLPRTTGLQFCLQQLRDTVEWVYDCTIAYEGIPYGAYGQDYFTLQSTYFQGRAPKSINMYWRRFAVASIPFDDSHAFDLWLRERWTEKDNFIEQYHNTGRLPIDESGGSNASGYMETIVRSKSRFEVLSIFAGLIPLVPIIWGLCALRIAVFG